MKTPQENFEKMLTKMISVIKPNGVSHIEFEIDPIDKNEYYMSVKYVVPNDSPYLKMDTSPRTLNHIRGEWNSSLSKSIKNFFDTEVIINSSGISSESFYKQHNQ